MKKIIKTAFLFVAIGFIHLIIYSEQNEKSYWKYLNYLNPFYYWKKHSNIATTTRTEKKEQIATSKNIPWSENMPWEQIVKQFFSVNIETYRMRNLLDDYKANIKQLKTIKTQELLHNKKIAQLEKLIQETKQAIKKEELRIRVSIEQWEADIKLLKSINNFEELQKEINNFFYQPVVKHFFKFTLKDSKHTFEYDKKNMIGYVETHISYLKDEIERQMKYEKEKTKR